MPSSLSKKIKNRINLLVYNFYTADLVYFKEAPSYSIKKQGFSIYEGTDYFRFGEELPESLQTIWNENIEKLGFVPYIILDKNGKMANYIFYFTSHLIGIGEAKRKMKADPKKEVMLYAGRTLPQYKGLGLSEYGKKHLFHKLHKQGFEKVYLMANKRNPISNHVNQKIGIPLTHRFYILRLLNKKFSIRLPILRTSV